MLEDICNLNVYLNRIRFWARSKAHALSYNPFAGEAQQPSILLTSPQKSRREDACLKREARRRSQDAERHSSNAAAGVNVVDNRDPAVPPPAPPPEGDSLPSLAKDGQKTANILSRFYRSAKTIIGSSWLNALLVFVPLGIALEFAHVSPTAIFTVNAIAIVPLAGLLSFATESVARKMGDTVGALMNVTFGNAVELIIFMYVTLNEIRIVQASLLGSILANLLLILGMCFLLGGLRFREQIYNSTVTQISACLLSLSVMSLLLPTAFHASFTDNKTADRAVLQVSRGTSVILLLIYVLYLLFQLKSHAYMYESTPQARIDEESHPGVLANIMGSSSSSDSLSSSSTSDTDNSSSSNNTVRRIRKVMRKGRRRRKSSSSSKDTPVMTPIPREDINEEQTSQIGARPAIRNPATEGIQIQDHGLASGDEADVDVGKARVRKSRRGKVVNFQQNVDVVPESEPKSAKKKHKKRRHYSTHEKRGSSSTALEAAPNDDQLSPLPERAPDVPTDQRHSQSPRPAFSIRNLSLVPKTFSSAGQSPVRNPALMVPIQPASLARAPYGIRRATSLPDRLNQQKGAVTASSGPPLPYVTPVNVSRLSLDSKDSELGKKNISKKAAIILLLVSTGLVALCAEFLVDSIDALVKNTGVSAAFVGLIILPIVGNAAEHVTAVTVASKNKMDLAIAVCLGSSIQIALFITPVIVLLGWILNKDMSLYFSLFETISLFVSAFIVNFLVLDGRSNYLEGALLCAAYIIIAVASFFYPDAGEQSPISGPGHRTRM
ncbi:MAG: hypothetical protein M1816_001469 [Peltula sp. TS41687]|nr:MAG: hypothetical protein M1816_001469 [Peltula sp. TS41687]